MSAQTTSNIKVCVRVRPENEREKAALWKPAVCVVDREMLVFDPNYDEEGTYFHGKQIKDPTNRKPRNIKFTFDVVFGPSVTNIDVYEHTTKPILWSLLEGYNCSVFAYGATGAGKTFSMLGSAQTPGVIFLSMMDLYNIKETERDTKSIDVSVSYLEVYNENIRDLLVPGTGHLPIRENGKNGVSVSGLSVKEPQSAEELLQMLERGNKNRSQHPTDANAESSRSHAIFQVFVKVRSAFGGLSDNVKISKLSLIDLAGSERATVSKNSGERLREGANINKSLLALGNCINALADTKKKGAKYVPYRNSKLTRILKDSLGDNCKTVMLAAVSPSRTSYEDTYNTLSYADRAKKIKTVVKQNEFHVEQHITNYSKIVDEMQAEILTLKEKLRLQTEQLALQSQIKAPAEDDDKPVCSFNIDMLQNEISVAYGKRRQIRDNILHMAAMLNQSKMMTYKQHKLINRIKSSALEAHVMEKKIMKLSKSVSASTSRQKSLETMIRDEEEQMDTNRHYLAQLVERGKEIDNSHAQQILNLQMKSYHYEQEARERIKHTHFLIKHLSSMSAQLVNYEKKELNFLQYLNASSKLISEYGLESKEYSMLHKKVRENIMDDFHVTFDNEAEQESDNSFVESLCMLPVISAEESSLSVTGELLVHECDNDVINGTFLVDSESKHEDSELCISRTERFVVTAGTGSCQREGTPTKVRLLSLLDDNTNLLSFDKENQDRTSFISDDQRPANKTLNLSAMNENDFTTTSNDGAGSTSKSLLKEMHIPSYLRSTQASNCKKSAVKRKLDADEV